MSPPTASRSERVFRALLRLFPRRFRELYGNDTAELFRDRMRDVHGRRFGLARLWLRTLPDLVSSGVLERITEARRAGGDLRPGAILRDATRSIRGSRALSATVVGMLAVGIGANTALFSVLSGVLLRPLPFPEPERLVHLSAAQTDGAADRYGPSPLDFVDWADARGFGSMAAWYLSSATYRTDAWVEELRMARVTPDFFRLLGVSPLVGRAFLGDEEIGDNGPVVLSYRTWDRLYGGDPSVVGHVLRTGDESHEIIGVMPPRFSFPDESVELWVAWDLGAYVDRPETRSWRFIDAIGRLSPGVTLSGAEEALNQIAASLGEAYPVTNEGWRAVVTPLREEIVGGVGLALWVSLGGTLFVLLVACANVANLLLARAPARTREVGIRAALGASRGRLAMDLVAEYAILGAAAGVAGLLFGRGLLGLIVAMDAGRLPRLAEVSMDAGVYLFTAAAAVATCVAFGLAPAIQLLGGSVLQRVGAGLRTTPSPRQRRAQETFVAAQVAVALVLLTGAVLFSASLRRVLQVDPGFDPTNVATFRVSPDFAGATGGEVADYYAGLLHHLEAVPAVLGVGATQALPLDPVGNDFRRPYRDVGSAVESAVAPTVQMRIVTPGYVDAIGMRLVAGTSLPPVGPEEPLVALVNETLARRMWEGAQAVGKVVEIDFQGGWRAYRVVGVVGDVRHYGLRSEAAPEVFLAHRQIPYVAMSVVARTDGEAGALFEALREAVRSYPPMQPASHFVTLDALVGDSTAEERFLAVLLRLSAAIALILATTGVYGLIAYSVSHRRREIGVRMALGAEPSRVVGTVLAGALVTTAAGLAAGAVAAVLLRSAVEGLLFGVDLTNPLVGLPGGGLLLVASGLAAYLPARRAARIPPFEALGRD